MSHLQPLLSSNALLAGSIRALLAQPGALAAGTRLLHSLPSAGLAGSRVWQNPAPLPPGCSPTAAVAIAQQAAGSPLALLLLVQPRRPGPAAALAAGGARGCHTAHSFARPGGVESICLASPVRSFWSPKAAQQAQPAALRQPQQQQLQAAAEQQPPEPWQPRPDPRRLFQPRPQAPGAATLAALALRMRVPDAAVFVGTAQKLSCERQHRLVAHAAAVASYLQAMGVHAATVARMLQHCPALFADPPEERAAPLMEELLSARVGLTTATAGEVFVRCPALANTRNVMVPIVRLVVEQQGIVWAGAVP